jgi:hypothetical protein
MMLNTPFLVASPWGTKVTFKEVMSSKLYEGFLLKAMTASQDFLNW